MTAQRVIAAVEPLLATQIKQAKRNGIDEITIPLGRAINIMHDLQLLKDTQRREKRAEREHEAMLAFEARMSGGLYQQRKEPAWLQ